MQRIVYTRQQELPLGIHFAPAIVREHGLRDAHVQPLVSRTRGESFRVHARHAWGYPSLELRAGNSWPALTLDCDLPTVVDALHSLKSEFPLPAPNMVVERVSNGHADPARLEIAGNPDHRGGPELFAVPFPTEVGRLTVQSGTGSPSHGAGNQ